MDRAPSAIARPQHPPPSDAGKPLAAWLLSSSKASHPGYPLGDAAPASFWRDPRVGCLTTAKQPERVSRQRGYICWELPASQLLISHPQGLAGRAANADRAFPRPGAQHPLPAALRSIALCSQAALEPDPLPTSPGPGTEQKSRNVLSCWSQPSRHRTALGQVSETRL